MQQLSIQNFITHQESFHAFRITHGSQNPLGLHTHVDFAEVFFVESGEGYHVVNGGKVFLQPGTICFIRPDDEHTVIGKDKATNITIINTAFRKETLNYFEERYFPGSDKYFFSKQKLPFHIQVDGECLESLVRWAERIFQLPWNNRILDPYLLKVCSLDDSQPYYQYPGDLPSWLVTAFDHFRDPDDFSKGINGFVKMAGRSHEHINRVLRKYLNQTLSEAVNGARIRYAARQLTMTENKIITIALDCNFPSLGYFYKCFKKYYGIAPDQYRKMNKSIL